MNLEQIAKAYGISGQAVGRWSQEKRQQAIAEIQAGANPEVKRLIGELAQACYVASCKTNETIFAEIWAHQANFVVIDGAGFIVEGAPINALALQGAIVKVQELCK
jgi:hypothetical protein